MTFGLNTPFGRAALLSFATALTPVPTAYAQEGNVTPTPVITTSDTVTYQTMAQVLKSAGLSEGDINQTQIIIAQNMFRFSRMYIRPAEMEEIETKVIAGIVERVTTRGSKLEEAETKLEEARAKLIGLETGYTELQETNSDDTDALIDLGDKIIEAEFAVEAAQDGLKYARAYQDISPEALAYAGINHAYHSFDPHSSYMGPGGVIVSNDDGPQGPRGGVGMSLETDGRSKYLIEEGIVVKSTLSEQDISPARKAGVKAGDLITHIDGEPVAGLRLRDLVTDKLQGMPGVNVALTIIREGEADPLSISVKRGEVKLTNVTHRIVDGNIGYIHIDGFMDPQMDDHVDAAIKKIQEELGGVDQVSGYIISVRDNGGGLLDQAVALSNTFIDAGADMDRTYGAAVSEELLRNNTVVSTRNRKGLDDRFLTEPGDLTGGKPVVVLVNGGSASASEIFAGTMQDYGRATIVGITSFGKGSVQQFGPTPQGQGRSKVTISYYFYGRGDDQGPFGRSIQGLGITPDVMATFVKASDVSEAGLAHTMATPRDADQTVSTSKICDQVKGFDGEAANLSLVDPRSGDYDYLMGCAIATIRGNGGENRYGVTLSAPQP